MNACVKRIGCLTLGHHNYVADPTKDHAEQMDEFYDGSSKAHAFDSYTEAGQFVDNMERVCPGAQWVIERA